MDIKPRRRSRKNVTLEEKIAILTDYNAITYQGDKAIRDFKFADLLKKYDISRPTLSRIIKEPIK